MPVDRPTFSESWYRVANLRPRLRATVQVYRQHFRGQMWYVVQDPSSNQFFRLSRSGYHFVALLDGRRTVAKAWQMCNEDLGDAAPTQGEGIQLLGQLYTSNLIHAELPPDAEGLLGRYRKRVNREVKGYLSNLLFIRIPLFDPDHFLNGMLPAVRWVFSWVGFVLWTVLFVMAGYFIIGRFGDLFNMSKNVLDPEGLPLFYASFIVVKVIHEFGHSFACKKFGRDAGTGGEVHTLGIMFLVFTPLPYMDASSAWAFRKKRHRAMVGFAGIWVELAIASIAAIIWANTSPNTPIHAVTFNVMFIASVSTLLFNANPLLRFDGYYILSDLLEIPNLNPRSKQYLYYLVRRYVWTVRRLRNPAHTRGEKIWFVFYGITSTIYRVFIVTAILLFVASALPTVGIILAIAAVVGWLFVPLGKFFKYLTTSNELIRTRTRAIATVAVTAGIIIGVVGFVPAPDRSRIEGIVEPKQLAFVYPQAAGFVRAVMPTDQPVSPDSNVLMEADNPLLEARLKILRAEHEETLARKRIAEKEKNYALAKSLRRALGASQRQIRDARDELDSLHLKPPIAGRWISPHGDRLIGTYVTSDQQIGMIASREMVIVALVDQGASAKAFEEVQIGDAVEIRIKGRADLELGGTVHERLEAGQRSLPSQALGYAIGGSMQTAGDDPKGLRTIQPFFQIRIVPSSDSNVPLQAGQRVMVRITGRTKPLARQWWRALLQLVQRRFSD